MTEFWVSQGKHWCDACKCWMSDTVNARAAHERGIGHKTNVQRKLRDMRIKADTEKKEAEKTERSLAAIEKAAEKAYAKDLAAQACPSLLVWGIDPGSSRQRATSHALCMCSVGHPHASPVASLPSVSGPKATLAVVWSTSMISDQTQHRERNQFGALWT